MLMGYSPPSGTRIEHSAGVVYLAVSASHDGESSHGNAGEGEAEENRHRHRRKAKGAADSHKTGNLPPPGANYVAARAPAIAVDAVSVVNVGSNYIGDSATMDEEVEVGGDMKHSGDQEGADRTLDPEEEDNDDRNIAKDHQKQEGPVD